MNIKGNLSLIFGVSIPILMIIFVAASIYIPQMFIKPEYNFLYLSGNNTCSHVAGNNQIFSVKNGKVVNNLSGLPNLTDQILQYCLSRSSEIKFYLYDMKAEKTSEVSFAYAQTLNLDPALESSDGFQIIKGTYSGGIFPFFYSNSDYNSRYVQGHNISKKINTQQGSYYNFTFLGWVKK
ncbi:MAG: hypothetical protein Q8Q48_03915 [Candidatus Staskawiczbacteria bacterium]|nr:hypothetical protein [Candidatus Staskawiczbacteria bacterium]